MKNNKIVFGILKDEYMGYKAGSKIYYYDPPGCDFALAYEENDTHYGRIFSNYETANVEVLEEYDGKINQTIFFNYFELVSNNVKIPIDLKLKFEKEI